MVSALKDRVIKLPAAKMDGLATDRDAWLRQIKPVYDKLVAKLAEVENRKLAEEYACGVRDRALEEFDRVYGEALAYAQACSGGLQAGRCPGAGDAGSSACRRAASPDARSSPGTRGPRRGPARAVAPDRGRHRRTLAGAFALPCHRLIRRQARPSRRPWLPARWRKLESAATGWRIAAGLDRRPAASRLNGLCLERPSASTTPNDPAADCRPATWWPIVLGLEFRSATFTGGLRRAPDHGISGSRR